LQAAVPDPDADADAVDAQNRCVSTSNEVSIRGVWVAPAP